MSRRDTERERDRRAGASASARTNEYFVPKDGIDREVITADICRYLGNDALVRPGKYENAQTGLVQEGYYITAYRNLTTAMIADLKADSARWDDERRATAPRGQPSNGTPSRDSNGFVRQSNAPTVGYRDSTTHQSRQYYGPTEGQLQSGYASSAAPGPQGGVYDSGPSYPSNSYGAPAGNYAPQPVYAMQSENYYVAGADLRTADPAGTRSVPQAGVSVPRTGNPGQYSATPQHGGQQPDPRGGYYSGQSGQQPPIQYSSTQQTSTDPYYGRAVPLADPMYSTSDAYADPRYQESPAYGGSQAPMPNPPSTVTPNTGSRRREEREPEPRDRHHRNSRR